MNIRYWKKNYLTCVLLKKINNINPNIYNNIGIHFWFNIMFTSAATRACMCTYLTCHVA